MKEFFSQLRGAIMSTIVLAAVCCGIYPLVVYGLGRAFADKADGSLIVDSKGVIRGSKLIGQNFTGAKYFHPRPSAAGNGYDPTSSGGSNLGPTSAKLINGTTKQPPPPAPPGGAPAPATAPAMPLVVDNDGLKLRVVHYCDDNVLPFEAFQDGKAVDLAPYRTSDGNWD